MSEPVIFGEDCKMEILVSDNWYTIMCQSDIRFRLTQEILLKTTPNSGLFREKTTRFSEGFASVTGLTAVNNGATNVSFFYIIQESIRTQPQTIKLTFTDQGGSSKTITGTVLIVTSEIGAPIGDFAEASVELEFSGSFEIDSTDLPTTANPLLADTWETTAGQNYISGLSTGWRNGTQYSLNSKEILEVDREGMQYDFIGNNLTPGNRECSWNTSLNRLVFQNDFNTGETVFVIFR